MDNATAVRKIARQMFDEFKKNVSDDKVSFTLHYLGDVSKVTDGKGNSRFVFGYGHGSDGKEKGISFPFTEDTYSVQSMAAAVYAELKPLLDRKLKKGVLLLPKYETMQYRFRRFGFWDWKDVEVFSSVTIIKPCKAFAKLNKKLVALGLKEIEPMRWNRCGVFGKREDYSITDCNYCCTSEKLCEEVLAFLKGRKRAEVEYVRHDDMQDREHGIRYETEWGWAIYNVLKVKTPLSTREFGW